MSFNDGISTPQISKNYTIMITILPDQEQNQAPKHSAFEPVNHCKI